MSMIDALAYAEQMRQQQSAAEQARAGRVEAAEAMQRARDAMLAAQMQKPSGEPVEAPTVAPVPLPPAIPDTPIVDPGLRIPIPGSPRARVAGVGRQSRDRQIDSLRVQAACSEAAAMTLHLENREAYREMLGLLKGRGLRGVELAAGKMLAWRYRQELLGKLAT